MASQRLPSLNILLQASEFQNKLDAIPKAEILLSLKNSNCSVQLPPIKVGSSPLLPAMQGPEVNGCVVERPLILTPAATPGPGEKTLPLPIQDCLMSPTPKRSGSVSSSPKKEFAFITHSKKSYPVKRPRVDNAQLARRKRRKTSQLELDILNEYFKVSQTVGREKRMELAEQCNMSEKAVQIWFQNKRQSVKKQLTKKVDSNLKIKSMVTLKDKSLVHTTPSKLSLNTDIKNEIILTSPSRQTSLPSPRSSPVTASKGPQALTFHLSRNDKVLKAVNKSTNNRVNKLINKYNSGLEKTSHGDGSLSIKKFKLAFKSSGSLPLKEIKQNVL